MLYSPPVGSLFGSTPFLVGDVKAGVKAEAAAQPLLVTRQHLKPCKRVKKA
jgi:hypothetical protein